MTCITIIFALAFLAIFLWAWLGPKQSGGEWPADHI